MKKTLTLLLCLILLLSLLSGCAGTTVVYRDDCTCAASDATSAPTESAPIEGNNALKTGLAIITSTAKSENASHADYDITLAAVTIDDNGVIRSCIIDSIGAKVEFDATGTVTSDLTAEIATKNELGESYGMVAWGGAKHEWNEQAAALAQYAVGKTVDELKDGAIDESGRAPEGTDLASTATIYLGGYISAIEAAAENAKHLGATTGDELRLASLSTVKNSKSATADENGTAQLDCDVTALTVNEGVITSCYIDSVQAKVNFDTTGTISTDLSAAVLTKNQLGESYGMVAWGGAIAEWDQQAASFAAYVTGKTAEEIEGIAVNEKTAPADADLSASVTIAIAGLQALISKALVQ